LIVLAFSVSAPLSASAGGRLAKDVCDYGGDCLYLNFFLLIDQLFEKVPALKQLAPTQTEPSFLIAQSAALLLFTFLGVRSAMKFHGEPLLSV
jgi:hypothetical protein